MKIRLMLILAIGVFMSAPTVHAANQLTMSGCGLGYQLFGKDNPNDQILQILAVTTNGTSMNNLFGITSGTSGCTEDGMIASNRELEVYVEVNFTNLAQEMAQGDGEYVVALTSLLGASEANRPALLKFFQDKYDVLYPSVETTPMEMLETLNAELSTHPDLLV